MKEGVDQIGRLSLELHGDHKTSYNDRVVISGKELFVRDKPSRNARLGKMPRCLTIEWRIATYYFSNLAPQTLQGIMIMLLMLGLHEIKPEMRASTVDDRGALHPSGDENHVASEVIEPV